MAKKRCMRGWGTGLLGSLMVFTGLWSEWPRPASAATAGQFPPGFIWGTATAAVQVEGDTPRSDWAEFEQRPGAIRDGQRIGDAARHFERYEQDFGHAQAMHTNGYRFSIEWSRLEPARGVWDERAAAHYRKMLRSLLSKGIRPMVTLHHFSNPQWVADQGGWLNTRTVTDYDAFVSRAARAFGELVDDWVTFNEPTIYLGEGYITGAFPPGVKGDYDAFTRGLANVAKAHARAYRSLHRLDLRAAHSGRAAARVGVAEHMVAFEASNTWNPLDQLVAFGSDRWLNYSFLDATITGQIRFMTGFSGVWEDVPELAGTLDFVGVNYYTRSLSRFTHPTERYERPEAPRTDLGLGIYPDGLLAVLTGTYARFHKPIMVTETGMADASRQLTPGFMVQHVQRISEAIAAGVPVEGLYWWSLMDNFEWQNGYSGRFGLLSVDFSQADRPRRWTPAAGVYARLARENRLPPDLRDRYDRKTPRAAEITE